jgi:hypothetical protein
MSAHPVDVGERTEAIILAELVRRGYRVLKPFGVNQRYDLVLDLAGQFLRVQCKTARLRKGVVEFNTQSVRCNMRQVVERSYVGDADLFLAYCPGTGKIYAIPVDQATLRSMRLRVDPTLNGQAKGVRWAKDFELPA